MNKKTSQMYFRSFSFANKWVCYFIFDTKAHYYSSIQFTRRCAHPTKEMAIWNSYRQDGRLGSRAITSPKIEAIGYSLVKSPSSGKTVKC